MAVQFNADNLGSFLRPQYLLDAHQRKAPPEELRALEDRAIVDVLKMQEAAGMPVVTDGEFRRELFFSTVVAVAGRLRPLRLRAVPPRRGGPRTPLRHADAGRETDDARRAQVDVEFAFTRQHTTRPIKVTMPSPR